MLVHEALDDNDNEGTPELMLAGESAAVGAGWGLACLRFEGFTVMEVAGVVKVDDGTTRLKSSIT